MSSFIEWDPRFKYAKLWLLGGASLEDLPKVPDFLQDKDPERRTGSGDQVCLTYFKAQGPVSMSWETREENLMEDLSEIGCRECGCLLADLTGLTYIAVPAVDELGASHLEGSACETCCQKPMSLEKNNRLCVITRREFFLPVHAIKREKISSDGFCECGIKLGDFESSGDHFFLKKSRTDVHPYFTTHYTGDTDFTCELLEIFWSAKKKLVTIQADGRTTLSISLLAPKVELFKPFNGEFTPIGRYMEVIVKELPDVKGEWQMLPAKFDGLYKLLSESSLEFPISEPNFQISFLKLNPF